MDLARKRDLCEIRSWPALSFETPPWRLLRMRLLEIIVKGPHAFRSVASRRTRAVANDPVGVSQRSRKQEKLALSCRPDRRRLRRAGARAVLTPSLCGVGLDIREDGADLPFAFQKIVFDL